MAKDGKEGEQGGSRVGIPHRPNHVLLAALRGRGWGPLDAVIPQGITKPLCSTESKGTGLL